MMVLARQVRLTIRFGVREALPPEVGHLRERGRPAQAEPWSQSTDPLCARGFREAGIFVCAHAVGRQRLSGTSATHARLDVGYSVGRSGRSSGSRGADNPPSYGKAAANAVRFFVQAHARRHLDAPDHQREGAGRPGFYC